METANEYYGVFCIALQLDNNRENDVVWEQACKLYSEFYNSSFNNPNESELDCINSFMESKKPVIISKYEYFSKWREKWIEFDVKPTKDLYLSYKAHFYIMRDVVTHEPLTLKNYENI